MRPNMVRGMDTIQLSARKNENFDPNNLVGEELVNILINGRDIREIVREVELPFATHDEKPEHAGAYEFLDPMDVFLPNKHFLGNPDDDLLLEDGKVPVLRCRCGVIDCYPLYTRITVQKDRVIWSDFENPWNTLKWTKEPWDYSSLYFVFDRNRYEAQLSGPGKKC